MLCILWSLVRSPAGEIRYTLLIRPNKIEAAVKCTLRPGFAGFSGNGNSNLLSNSSVLKKKMLS